MGEEILILTSFKYQYLRKVKSPFQLRTVIYQLELHFSLTWCLFSHTSFCDWKITPEVFPLLDLRYCLESWQCHFISWPYWLINIGPWASFIKDLKPINYWLLPPSAGSADRSRASCVVLLVANAEISDFTTRVLPP